MMELDFPNVSEGRQRHLDVGEVGVGTEAFLRQFLSFLVHVFHDLVSQLSLSSVVYDNIDILRQ
jgi:hypothetical protein